MNSRCEDQRPRRTSQIYQKMEQDTAPQPETNRSTFFGYPSLMNIFAGMFRTPNYSAATTEARTQIDAPDNSQRNRKIWEQQLNRGSVLHNFQTKKLLEKPIDISVRDKVYASLLPNRQKITQKLFSILEERVGKLQQGTIEPLFMQTTINMAKDDIKQLFTNTFVQSRPQTIKNLNLILKCFSIHRLDIGQRKAIALFAGVLFGILNENVLLTFTQLCHMTLSSCFVGFLLQHEGTVEKIQREIDLGLQDTCPGVYVLLNHKYKIPIRYYVGQWIGSLFLCLQLESINSKLDRYYENNEDEFIMKVLNYLFYNKFSKDSLIRATLCLVKSLQKQIFRQDNREVVLSILKRPRSFLDERMFIKDLFS